MEQINGTFKYVHLVLEFPSRNRQPSTGIPWAPWPPLLAIARQQLEVEKGCRYLGGKAGGYHELS